MHKHPVLFTIGGIALVGVAWWFSQGNFSPTKTSTPPGGDSVRENLSSSNPITRIATVYKEPNCGCCNGYIAALEERGFTVEVKSQDTRPIKEQYGIVTERQSCHTTVIGDYFIEGHVPISAVDKLLSEQPDIEGIGLPGMPLGTPGMPGIKQAPYEIYQKQGPHYSSYLTL